MHSAGVATCDTPAWPLGNATSLSVGMQLTWPDSTSLVVINCNDIELRHRCSANASATCFVPCTIGCLAV